jgi:hypothetical protein
VVDETKTSGSRRAGALRRLADRVGILPEYVDYTGREVRVTSDETRVALLRAMGLDASTEAAARSALREIEATEAALLEPVRVRLRGGRDAARLSLRLPDLAAREVRWSATLVTEAPPSPGGAAGSRSTSV